MDKKVSDNSTLPSTTSISVILSALSSVVIADTTLPTNIIERLLPYPAFNSNMQSLPSSTFKLEGDKFHICTFPLFGVSELDFSILNDICNTSLSETLLPISHPFAPLLPHTML